jgi:hypothetical protein
VGLWGRRSAGSVGLSSAKTLTAHGFVGNMVCALDAIWRRVCQPERRLAMFGGAPIRLATGVAAVALAMVVGMGLASPDFAFAAAKPVVTHVSPATGSTLGGTTVRISGKHFMANGHSLVKKVRFGKRAATHVHVRSKGRITVTAPVGKGTVNVTVTTTAGTSAKVSADKYTYRAPAAPTVTNVNPNGGPIAGSTAVTITGTGFSGTPTVHFGANAATKVEVVSATEITCTSPAGAAGTVDVTVTTTAGTSAKVSADKYTYRAPAASKLVVTTQPVGGVSGATLATQPVVKIEDSAGNVVSSSATITVTSSAGSTLGGSQAAGLAATGGVATFSNLTLAGLVNTSYTLTFAASGLKSATSSPTSVTLAIGTPYGGGVVAYILQSGDPGYVAGQTHGLIAATVDQSTGIIWALPAYQSTAVGGTSTAIGTGLANTNAIILQNGVGTTYAAGLARAYTGGGYADWYLPSKDELNELYLNRVAIGMFESWSTSYWSSSEALFDSAWTQDFASGDQGENGHYKWGVSRVRAIRAF